MTDTQPIGIFDSGPGGLAVMLMMQQWLSHEDVLYVGDTNRQPYELRSREEVCQITVEIAGFLIDRGVKLVVIGCNTATVAGLAAAQAVFPGVPILGMIEPGVRAALRYGRGQRFGVLGSIITVGSGEYEKRIQARMPEATVVGEIPSDLFRYTEKGNLEDQEALRRLTEHYYQPLAEASVETVILGCTDLTCVRDLIQESAGEDVIVIDPAEQVVLEAKELLQKMGSHKEAGPPHYRFLITGQGVEQFADYARSFLNLAEVNVQHIALEQVRQPTAGLSFPCSENRYP
jgi:glutamate racemase